MGEEFRHSGANAKPLRCYIVKRFLSKCRAIMENIDSLDKLEAMLLEGLDSGKSVEMTDELWEQMRSLLIQRFQGKTIQQFINEVSDTNEAT
jgi:hypothetical protein